MSADAIIYAQYWYWYLFAEYLIQVCCAVSAGCWFVDCMDVITSGVQ